MKGKKRNEETTDTGLNKRLIMSMASEMADMQRSTNRACVLFQALALDAGINVANAFAAE